jgi:hypothetical protein
MATAASSAYYSSAVLYCLQCYDKIAGGLLNIKSFFNADIVMVSSSMKQVILQATI